MLTLKYDQSIYDPAVRSHVRTHAHTKHSLPLIIPICAHLSFNTSRAIWHEFAGCALRDKDVIPPSSRDECTGPICRGEPWKPFSPGPPRTTHVSLICLLFLDSSLLFFSDAIEDPLLVTFWSGQLKRWPEWAAVAALALCGLYTSGREWSPAAPSQPELEQKFRHSTMTRVVFIALRFFCLASRSASPRSRRRLYW